jgi:hypothetical protein
MGRAVTSGEIKRFSELVKAVLVNYCELRDGNKSSYRWRRSDGDGYSHIVASEEHSQGYTRRNLAQNLFLDYRVDVDNALKVLKSWERMVLERVHVDGLTAEDALNEAQINTSKPEQVVARMDIVAGRILERAGLSPDQYFN